jgi:signal transduction histidine kinase
MEGLVATVPAQRNQEDVAHIVHDLKNPLATIALELCLLDCRLAGMATEEAKRALLRITQNVEFMDRLVHDLLDLALIDSGHLEIHRRWTEIRSLLEDVLDRSVSSRDRGRVFLEASTPMTLAVDDMRIQRVVANLIQNALKYSPPSSGIVVRLEPKDEHACISVTDAGPGISPADAATVFEQFRRTSEARAKEGTGLGLYVSRKIVEAHGGRIGVDSVRGAGSRFYFELPRDTPPLGDRRNP